MMVLFASERRPRLWYSATSPLEGRSTPMSGTRALPSAARCFTSIEVARFVDFRGPGGRDKAKAMLGDLLDSDGSINETKVLARIARREGSP